MAAAVQAAIPERLDRAERDIQKLDDEKADGKLFDALVQEFRDLKRAVYVVGGGIVIAVVTFALSGGGAHP